MTVQLDLENLEKLQELDLKTHDIRNEIENIPKHIEEIRQNVNTVRVILQKEENRLADAESWRSEKEHEISLQNELLAKSKSKLQGARNEKESKAATREIETIKKNIQDHEKEQLELMEAIEQYIVAMEEHKKEFSELEAELALSEKDGNERIAQIQAELIDADESRKKLTVIIDEKILRLYERIHRRLPVAIVKVKEPICPGCNVNIRPQIFNEIIRGEIVHTCQSCMRLLVYYTDETLNSEEDEKVSSTVS
ncbi:MAG: hypothetical protein JXR91_15725 [Deltaproteobacteria bacterium]|nr:hypothetical protein [Deltaproteobacteria bacterium]